MIGHRSGALLLERVSVPIPHGLMHGIDVADGQGFDLTEIIRTHRPDHVVIHLYTILERPSELYTIRQAASARALGCSLGGYLFCYPGTLPETAVASALDIAYRAGIWPLPVLWLDVEPYGNETVGADWIARAVAASEHAGQRVGVYTARGVWTGGARFGHLPLWDAVWDGNETLGDMVPYGGWTSRLGHQYMDRPVDLDVFDASVTVAA
jgi:hypothetical protein